MNTLSRIFKNVNARVILRRFQRARQVPDSQLFRKLDRGLYINDAGLSFKRELRPPEHEVRHCEAWLREFARPQKSVNRSISSYTLKHIVERWPYEGATWPDVHGYCSNGALIEAAIRLGYKLLPTEGSLNCYFNVRLRKSRKTHIEYFFMYLPWNDEKGSEA